MTARCDASLTQKEPQDEGSLSVSDRMRGLIVDDFQRVELALGALELALFRRLQQQFHEQKK